MPRKPTPEPVIISLQLQRAASKPSQRGSGLPTDRRQASVDEFLQVRSLSENSQKAYRQDLKRFLEWTETDWPQVSYGQIVQYQKFLIEQSLAPATVKRAMATLQKFFRWMVDSGYIPKDPTSAVATPHDSHSENTHTTALSPTELAQIYEMALAGSFPKRDTALISVLLHGVRAEEISALDIGGYRSDRLQVRTTQVISQVPLNDQARKDLETYLASRTRLGESLSDSCPLFLSYSRRSYGQRLSAWGVRDVLNKLQAATGFSLHPHRFRHTFVARLMHQDLDLHQVIALTRHKSAQSLSRYAQESPHPA
ncbi:tyrosine-type recombinase/integrase [Pseudanabaena sp. FACHB-2040]|uniref:tyrosine-type recombinase/integrase n=1 Tax=Pseudanabaena sp. FACHB-2040 TaxID=2692859 RepID=UPI001684074A|nr:tyrosine-type recombinase/integrase [Pseudanabaena sp. FACHB-2040]MBD2258329.1 tyrosine-type recombinase/integrase [Pseudanabaena sp. FACHB-2040]